MFYKDNEFLKKLIFLSLPIIAQQFVMASLNMVDVFMIGQLGDIEVAAVGIGNQFTFVVTFISFGITSGASIFTSQFWGKRDSEGIKKVLGVCLLITVSVGSLAAVVTTMLPELWFMLFGAKETVAKVGAEYIKIVGISYFFMTITFTYAAQLRSIENVKLPMIASLFGVGLNSVLNLILIFGAGPLPALGVKGAAIATLIARVVESGILVGSIYARKLVLAARPGELITFSPDFVLKYINTASPVLINEVIWVLGVSAYNMIYSRIGTESMAAIGIVGTFEGMAFVLFTGLSHASSVMMGNKIGASENERAFTYGKHTLVIGILGAIVIGGAIVLTAPLVLSLYNVSEVTKNYAFNILVVISLFLWVKVSNLNLIGGILRSGGDTRIGVIIDLISVWLIGLPAAFIAAFYFELPVYFVVLVVMSDEVVKCIIAFKRFLSRKWINDVTV
jgi:putative MATE family efflux protein